MGYHGGLEPNPQNLQCMPVYSKDSEGTGYSTLPSKQECKVGSRIIPLLQMR